MSSRIAVCGQHPVSTAAIRSSGSTADGRKAFASSEVKMSLVTTTSERSSRSNRHSDPTSVVLPLPTGPPMPTRKARVTPLSRWRAGDARWNRSLCNGSCGMSCGGTGTPVFGEEDGERAGDAAGEVIGHAMNSRASRPPWSLAEDLGERAAGRGQIAMANRSTRRSTRRAVHRPPGPRRLARLPVRSGRGRAGERQPT